MTQPLTNGLTKTRAATTAPHGPRPWPEICSVLRRKVSDLLRQGSDDDAVLGNTQLRVRESLAVIGEALQKYGCVGLASPCRSALGSHVRPPELLRLPCRDETDR